MTRATWLLLTAMALPLSIPAANAAVNPDKLPQVPCSDVKFSAAFLAKWPRRPPLAKTRECTRAPLTRNSS